MEEHKDEGGDGGTNETRQQPRHPDAGGVEYGDVVELIGVGTGHCVEVLCGFFTGDLDDAVGGDSADELVVSIKDGGDDEVIFVKYVLYFLLVGVCGNVNGIRVDECANPRIFPACQQQSYTYIAEESAGVVDDVDTVEVFVDFGCADFADGFGDGGIFGDANYDGVHNAAG